MILHLHHAVIPFIPYADAPVRLLQVAHSRARHARYRTHGSPSDYRPGGIEDAAYNTDEQAQYEKRISALPTSRITSRILSRRKQSFKYILTQGASFGLTPQCLVEFNVASLSTTALAVNYIHPRSSCGVRYVHNSVWQIT